MSEKQFDIFDDQFKNAAEQYEPAYSEAAWEKMQARLDEGGKRRRPAGWLWWLSDALMFSLLLYLAFTFYGHKDNKNTVTNNSIPAATQTIKDEISELTQKERNASVITPAIEQNKTGENTTMSGTSKVSKEKISGKDQQQSYKLKQTEESSDKKGTSVKEKNTALENNIAKTASNKNTSEGSAAETISTSNEDQTLGSSRQETITSNVDASETPIVEQAKIAGTAVVAEGSAVSQKPAVTVIDSAENKQNLAVKKTTSKQPQNSSKGFFLHAGLAPEFTFVKGSEKGPVKLLSGGGIGYTISNRWSVQAGVYFSEKKYIAGPTDYKFEAGSYLSNVSMYYVEAECRITEIPLSVNYNVFQRGRHSVVLSAGLSSLIMNKEWYNYHFERMNGMYGKKDTTFSTNEFNLFAATQLSAGYQFKLNNKFSVSASPYIKIPLYGVGEGSVKITSAGVMMGLQYQLPSRKKPKR